MFSLMNLREGQYHLRALKDADANYRFNQVSEAIAFQEEVVTVGQDTSNQPVLRLFVERIPLQIVEVDSSFGQVKLVFNRPLRQGGAVVGVGHTLSRCNGDSLFLWHHAERPWTLVVQADSTLQDTLAIPAAPRGTEAGQLPVLTFAGASAAPSQLPADVPLQVLFNRGIRGIDTSLLVLTKDTLTDKMAVKWEVDSLHAARVNLRGAWQTGNTCTLQWLPGAVEDVNGQRNQDTLVSRFSIMDAKRLGVITVVFVPSDSAVYSGSLLVNLGVKGKLPAATFRVPADQGAVCVSAFAAGQLPVGNHS
ncbi:MAG: hypothetical protein R2795_09720 [Saprospiraceae bacterium]